jgi:hypothetical protein
LFKNGLICAVNSGYLACERSQTILGRKLRVGR